MTIFLFLLFAEVSLGVPSSAVDASLEKDEDGDLRGQKKARKAKDGSRAPAGSDSPRQSSENSIDTDATADTASGSNQGVIIAKPRNKSRPSESITKAR